MSDEAKRQLAQRRIEQFERSIQSAAHAMGEDDPHELAALATRLASHAALAVAFDPGLLHLLRINFFFDDERLPYWVEARLLLSGLCRDAEGSGLYTMEAPVRDLLLAQLAATYGPARLREVATLLWQYTERRSRWVDRPELRHAQQLTALNFLAPERALAWLDEAQAGSSRQALPEAWFVAMRHELPALPTTRRDGDPAAACTALQALDFIAQRAAHRDAMKTSGLSAYVISGPRFHAQRWLLMRLLKHFEVPPGLVEITVHAEETRSIDELIAAALALPSNATWAQARARIASLAASRPIVIAIHGTQSRGVGQRQWLEDLLRGDLPVSLYFIDDTGQPRIPVTDRVASFPRIERIGRDDLRYWLDRHAAEAGFDTGQPTRPSEQVADEILAATNGQPQRVLEHLCMRCGVAWPEVLAHAEAPYKMRPPPPDDAIAELAQLYQTRRAGMAAGAARTRAMEDVVSRMRQLLATRPDWPVQSWTGSDNAGLRLAAAVWLQLQPQPALCDWLGARMAIEKPFVAFHSVVALMNAARTLPVEQLDVVRSAVQRATNSMSKFDRETDRADVLRRAERILEERNGPVPTYLTVLPLRNAVVLPGERVEVLVDRNEGFRALGQRMNGGDGTLFAVRDQGTDATFDPSKLCRVGTVVEASVVHKGSDGLRVTLEGRARAVGAASPDQDASQSVLFFQVTRLPEVTDAEVTARDRAELMDALRALARIGGTRSQVASQLASGPVAPVCYALAVELDIAAPQRQQLLEDDDARAMILRLLGLVFLRIEASLPESFGADNLGFGQPRLASLLEGAFIDVEDRRRLAGYVDMAQLGATVHRLVDRAADTHRLRALAARALALRPDNDALWEHVEAMSASREDDEAPSPQATRRVRQDLKLWPQGSTLRIRFLGGDAGLRKRVIDCARQWFEHTNLRFELLPRSSKEPGDIRIAFDTQGTAWAYVGTDARSVTPKEPTLQLAVDTKTPEAEFNAAVLKQFGHALGLLQEHQNPNGGIDWDVEGVVQDLGSPPQSWSRQQIDDNILKRMRPTRPPYRPFDPASVMLQAIPARWLRSNQALQGGTELSESDKRFIASLYPPSGPSSPSPPPS